MSLETSIVLEVYDLFIRVDERKGGKTVKN